MTSMKTTRTALQDLQVPTRWSYSFARTNGQDHAEAVKTAAHEQSINYEMAEKWTRDLRKAFDGDDDQAKDLAFVSAALKQFGPIKRVACGPALGGRCRVGDCLRPAVHAGEHLGDAQVSVRA